MECSVDKVKRVRVTLDFAKTNLYDLERLVMFRGINFWDFLLNEIFPRVQLSSKIVIAFHGVLDVWLFHNVIHCL